MKTLEEKQAEMKARKVEPKISTFRKAANKVKKRRSTDDLPHHVMKGKLNGDGFTETGTDTEATGPA